MLRRIIDPVMGESFFLFGARGTGKTSLLKECFSPDRHFWVNLLRPSIAEAYRDCPENLIEQLDVYRAKTSDNFWVIIDEIQKVPQLLDLVHEQIEERGQKFALTGSSARKLKRGGANLLAGRALLNYLFPLTHLELGERFNLEETLTWGTLPKVTALQSRSLKRSFLNTYVETYLKEEILEEQIVRNILPFKKFLNIASQTSSRIVNFQKIADDIKVDWSTVKTYFEILEDSLLGFFLPAYDRSVRKQQLKASKFYLFDIGVKRCLDKTIGIPDSGLVLGPLFEQFVICEIHRLNSYYRSDFTLSHFATHAGAEIDLVIERPGQDTVFVEIKYARQVVNNELRILSDIVAEDNNYRGMCLSREPIARSLGSKVTLYNWREGIQKIFNR
jgi:predicted AAA+ superfamily ATPase